MKKSTLYFIIENILIILFFPLAFVTLLAISLLSGIGGTIHVIRKVLIPAFKTYIKDFKSFYQARPSKKM